MSLPRRIRCTVGSIVDHGERVYTVELVPASPAPPFSPGQFMHLTIDECDPAGYWPESRVFSIASSPLKRDRIRICYSVAGRYTRRMEQALKVGGQVWIKLPYGDFVIGDADDVVLIAGGTGISAFATFLESLSPEHARSVTLVYGARSRALLLFQDMILSKMAQVPRLSLLLFSEAGDQGPVGLMGPCSRRSKCFTGRIAMDVVWPQLIEPASQTFYLSGPPAMVKAFGADLRARGVKPEGIRIDAWA